MVIAVELAMSCNKRREGLTDELIGAAIKHVKTSRDPDIRGLVSIMAKKLQDSRTSYIPNVLSHHYLGGEATNIFQCTEDSQVFLARYLLEKSAPEGLTVQILRNSKSPFLITDQIRTKAYELSQTSGKDDFSNWILAQHSYVCGAEGFFYSIEKPHL
ncbi:MAG: hypothetical protein WC438_03730 [Candidatus Pacearchaeota archaeon]